MEIDFMPLTELLLFSEEHDQLKLNTLYCLEVNQSCCITCRVGTGIKTSSFCWHATADIRISCNSHLQ